MGTANALEKRIKRMIAHDGPLRLSTFMSLALGDPRQGYYTTQEPFGVKGDFTTAPEISQLFGEMVGLCLIQCWQKMGEPDVLNLIECGPGRGTLMKDVLRTIESVPQMRKAVRVHLVEISPKLRAEQARTLSSSATILRWHNDLDALPEGPCFIVANEFFDALPIDSFQFAKGQWHERCIGLDEDDKLVWQLQPCTPPALAAQIAQKPNDGDILETSLARDAAMETLSAHITRHSGMILAIDYGHAQTAFGDTLQAMRNHSYVDALDAPGTADITSHVDFESLTRIAGNHGLHTPPVMTQGAFLLAHGILERAGALGAGKDADTQTAIADAVERLAGDAGMGKLFKVMLASHDQGMVPSTMMTRD